MRGGVAVGHSVPGRAYRRASSTRASRLAFGLVAVPDDLHEWISFEDPDEQRTWVFDATFLRSNYRCIYGAGCQGILDAPAPELAQGCCSYGAHFVDDDDVANVVKAFVRLRPEQMQFHAKARRGRVPAARRARRRRRAGRP